MGPELNHPLSNKFDSRSFTWSPCGRLVTAGYRGAAEIWDPLTSEPLSNLQPTKPTYRLVCALAYSPDGRTLAALSTTSFIIWDIKTGGVAKEIECGAEVRHGDTTEVPLVWSLDGQAIAIRATTPDNLGSAVHVYNIASGAVQSHVPLQPLAILHLWAHGESFRIVTTKWDQQTRRGTIDVSEVGSVLTKIESFHIGLEVDGRIDCFSPTAYRIVVLNHGQCQIFDIRNRERLLEEARHSSSHCFSSDGGLFAAILGGEGCVQVWKYGSGCYTAWGKFSAQGINASLQFSPDLSSIAAWFPDFLRV